MILDLPKLSCRYQPTEQTWLISIYHSRETFRFLSAPYGPTSILSDIVMTLRKSHKIIFVTYFWKTKNTCERCFWDVSQTSRKRHLFWDMLETLIDVTQKASFLRCFWDVLKMSKKRHLFWDVSERSLRYMSQWRSDWGLSETSHAGWDSFLLSWVDSELLEHTFWHRLMWMFLRLLHCE